MSVDGRECEVSSKKSKALLTRLAFLQLDAGQERRISRDILADLLWPTSSSTSARHSLRQALSDLRRCFTPYDSLLKAESEQVWLSSEMVIDLVEFRRNVTSGDVNIAYALYHGDMLEGFELNVVGYDQWLVTARENLRQQFISLLHTLIDTHDDDSKLAIPYAQRLLVLDPFNEVVYRNLMMHYIAGGEDGRAIKQFLTCQALLKQELGIQPEPATISLYEGLLSHRNQLRTNVATGVENVTNRALRPCALLAFRLCSIPEDPEKAEQVFDETVDRVRGIAEQAGGTVVSRSSGVVIVAFGLHHIHATEADRACFVAEECLAKCEKLAAGLSFGLVLVDYSVLQSKQKYWVAVSGGPMLQVERIVQLANMNECLLDKEAVESLRLQQRIVPLDNQAYRLLGVGLVANVPETVQSVSLIAREFEVHQFLAILGSCRGVGNGCTLLVRGEAGVGKTAYGETCGRLALAEGFATLRVQIFDFGNGVRKDPMGQLCEHLLRENNKLLKTDNSCDIENWLKEQDFEPSMAPFVLDMLGLPLSSSANRIVGGLSALERLERRVEILHRLLQMCVRVSPLWIFVEDLHWADDLVLALVARLASLIQHLPVVLMVTSRMPGEALDPGWRAQTRGARLQTFDLQPLADRDIHTLVAQFGASDEEQLVIADRCGGNPLFAEQLARQGSKSENIPASIQALAVSRLDSQKSALQCVLKAASVLGQTGSLDVLSALTTKVTDLPHTVAELVEELLFDASHEGYRFHHAMIREGIYHSLLNQERCELHRQAAAWYQDRDLTLFAEHLDLAQDAEAGSNLLRAATTEYSGHRLAIARKLSLRAVAYPNEAAQAYIMVGDIDLAVGSFESAVQNFEQALVVATNDRDKALAQLGRARLYNLADKSELAIGELTEAIERVTGDSYLLAELHHHLGNALFPMGQSDTCLQAYTDGLRYAQTSDDVFSLARAEGGLGDANYQRGAMKSAFHHYDRCVELALAHDMSSLAAANIPMRGLAAAFDLDMARYSADCESATQLAKITGNVRHRLVTINVLSCMAPYMDDTSAAIELAQESLEVSLSIGVRRFIADSYSTLAHLHWISGDIKNALSCSDLGLEHYGVDLLSFGAAITYGVKALCSADMAQRNSFLEQGYALLAKGSISHAHLFFYTISIEALLKGGEFEKAMLDADKLEHYVRGEPVAWACFYVDQSRLIALQKDSKLATRLRPALLEIDVDHEQWRLMRIAKGAGLRFLHNSL